MSTKGVTYKKTSRADTFKIYELLKEHGTVDGEYYTYKDGWSDREILKAVGGNATIWVLRDIRQNEFGKLRASPGASGFKPIMPRVNELETLYLELAKRVEHLEKNRDLF